MFIYINRSFKAGHSDPVILYGKVIA